MSPWAIFGISYGVIGLGLWRKLARDCYYLPDKDGWKLRGKLIPSLWTGLLLGGLVWPFWIVGYVVVNGVEAAQWLGKKRLSSQIRSGLVLLLLGRPPEPDAEGESQPQLEAADEYDPEPPAYL